MKKLLIAAFVLCLLLAGCSKAPESTPNLPVFTPPATTQGHDHDHEHTPTRPDGSRPPVSTTAPTEPDLGPAEYITYVPNENADGFIEKNTSISSLHHEGVLLFLQLNNAVNSDVQANFCTRTGNALHLDLNEAFLTQLQATDANGERMLIGSIVNTFLSAYQCDSVLLTVNGKSFSSAHATYNSPLTFFQ